MIGMVRVKVMGSVRNGERIYASIENPGVGLPQSRLVDATSKDAVLLGQSLESTSCKSYDVTRPQCFVSLILTIGTGHVTQVIDDLRSEVREDVKSEVKNLKKKCIRGMSTAVAVCLSVCLHPLFVCLAVYPFVCLSNFLSVCLIDFLSVRLYICIPVLSIGQSVCLSALCFSV